jgi:multiple sugar transport system ATP-binding protein
MATVRLDGVTKRFGDVSAVDDLTLTIPDGELLVLLGPSGCGKTTALRMVAGLEEPTAGTIEIGDRVVNDVEPKDRDVAMVFQTYALYPHLTVQKNIEFPLRHRGVAKEERESQMQEAAQMLGLTPLLDRKPAQLSGGQRQRVALARAIVRSPQVFLMDEPLSNLDATLRVQTRADIVTLQRRLGITTLYVTHDQVEAMTMGHRIAVMKGGVLQQVAPPQDLYESPANTFVAAFIGSPGMNLIAGALDRTDPRHPVVRVGDDEVALPERLVKVAGESVDVSLGARPEAMAIDATGSIKATVTIVEVLGAEVHVIARLSDDTRIVVRQDVRDPRPAIGQQVSVSIQPDGMHLFEAATGERLEPLR